MSSPLAAVNKFEFSDAGAWGNSNFFQFAPGSLNADSSNTALAAALGDFKYRASNRDHKLTDFLLLGVLSVLIHGTLVEQFKGADFEQEIIEPIKPEPKVQITLTRPQPPKPVPPPPQVKPQPPVQKVVPLKPQKPKPVKKVIEQAPIIEPAPVVETAPVSTPAPAVSTPTPAPVVEEKITAPVAGADYLHNPAPEYPEAAQERGLEGKVLLKVHVLPDGKPDNIVVARSSGHQILDDAAIKTVHKWSFVPAKRGETPIAGYVTVPITFNLS